MNHRLFRGYSLIELLVVLAIVGILAMVGITMLGNRPSGAVRSVMDDLEGTIAAAHKRAVATGRDVNLVANGGASDFTLAYGETTTPAGVVVSNATILANGATAPESFHYRPNSRDHAYAGVVVGGSDWWSRAKGGSADIKTILPFSDSSLGFNTSGVDAEGKPISQPIISDPSSDACNLSNLQSVGVSGYSKRFNGTFYLAVVGLRGGQPITDGPMGLLVVQGNGATVYKFYNPGKSGGDGQWRRV